MDYSYHHLFMNDLWLLSHSKGKIGEPKQRLHCPQSLEYLLPGLLQKLCQPLVWNENRDRLYFREHHFSMTDGSKEQNRAACAPSAHAQTLPHSHQPSGAAAHEPAVAPRYF